MGKHVRTRPLRSHRKPSATRRAAATTAAAAMGTATAGAIIVSSASGHHAPAVVQLPAAAPAANVSTAPPPLLHSLPVHTAAWVTVKSGQTLSGIAGKNCPSEADWTGIYVRNKKTIGNDPNLIQPGQELALDCKTVSLPVVAAVTADIQPAVHHHYQAAQPAVSGGHSVSGSFQACVIQRESGGNSQVMNSSGHYGLYQFSEQTWAGHGGNPADFGHASAAEQTQVFWNTVHADGTSDWAPYDGC